MGTVDEQKYGEVRRMFVSIVCSGANSAISATSQGVRAAVNTITVIDNATTGASAIMGTVADGTVAVAKAALGSAGIGAGTLTT